MYVGYPDIRTDILKSGYPDCSKKISEYFKILLSNPLQESFTSNEIDENLYYLDLKQHDRCASLSESAIAVIKLRNICVAIFTHVLYYVYQDYARLSSDTVYDVLIAADMYLLPGLKRQCGAFIGSLLDIFNIWSALKTARLFELPRLEDQCYQFLAENLEKIIDCVEFQDFIREDAKAVQKRQDVDSIDIVDNIRFHLTATSMDDARDKLSMMDHLLDALDLTA
uniref:BTB domain-containing protein n=1 Tax=Romanomermis culicivorax TaxID=13658 RepID=A0A915JZC4_ROMCU